MQRASIRLSPFETGSVAGPGRPRRIRTVVALAALLAGTLTACRNGGTEAAPAPVRGGTLNVYLSTRDISTLDPQEISYGNDANFSRLVTRTLTTTLPDGRLVADLATDLGRPSQGNTVWDFTLRPGVKWADGSAVTCEDVRYGIERWYASTITGGLPYPGMYLRDNVPPYKGPYNGTQLDSIQCLDTRNVEFHLQRAVGDFGYTVSVQVFAPVKRGADHANAGADAAHSFGFDPISNGPYKVDPAQTKMTKIGGADAPQTLVFVRNNFWDPNTDPLRKAYPDKIVVRWDANAPEVTNNLINDTGDYHSGILLDADVAPNFVQQVINDPVLSQRVTAGSNGGTRYFALNTRRLTTLTCRQALEYGFDKRAFRYVAGGATAGDLATGIIPPDLPAHAEFDLYETKSLPDGDTTKAKQLLASGNCPDSIRLAYPDVPLIHQEANSISDAYARIGVDVNQDALNPETYNQLIGDPTNHFDMMYTGWLPDWPNGSAIIPPLFSGAQIANPASNLDFAELNDPTINSLIDQAYAESILATQYHLWGELDRKIMEQAAIIPVLYTHALRMFGGNVRGAQLTAAYGEPDLTQIGVGPQAASSG